MTRIALIADPHFHDLAWTPAGTDLPGAIRSYTDTAASTRVFNESAAAFRAALDRVVAEKISVVVIVGDLTDDGQEPNIRAAMALLDSYSATHGLRFFATPGNHDLFAVKGRHQTKEFLRGDGTPVTVTSDPAIVGALLSPDMATMGTRPALDLMATLGFQRGAQDLHWESPFGTDEDFGQRTYVARSPSGKITYPMIDASYLVEPVEGLWLLSVDANVATPDDDGGFSDPTDGGWDAVLDQRPYLLDWMTDVASRAKFGGKALLAFSHYPVLDALGGTSAEEVALFGATGLAKRAPSDAVARAFAATGVTVHVSGHLHVNDTALHPSGFANIAAPSPVGFPAAMKIARVGGGSLSLRTIPLDHVPGHDRAFAAYRAEAKFKGRPAAAACAAASHGAFIDAHLQDLVATRYIAREWPTDMAAFLPDKRSADLLALLGVELPGSPDFAMKTLVEDWYRLRKGADAATRYIAPERLAFYRSLCTALPDLPEDSLAGRFTAFLRIMRRHLARPPTSDFTLDLAAMRMSDNTD